VAFLGDGDLLMTCNALWTAAHHQIPLLVILQDNRSYQNDWQHQVNIAKQRGRSVETTNIGTEVDNPPPNFAKIAEGLGCYGEGPIESPNGVKEALERAVRKVREGTLAVVDTVTQKR